MRLPPLLSLGAALLLAAADASTGAPAAPGTAVEVLVEAPAGASASQGRVAYRQVDLPSPGPELEVALSGTPKSAKVLVDTSHAWEFRAELPGFWSTRAILMPNESPRSIVLRAWPSALLKGRLEPATDCNGVRLLVEFLPAEPGRFPDEPPHDHQTCSVDESAAKWQCEVPAGKLDLVLRAKGFAPQYRRDQVILPGTAADLGVVPLKRGASLVGQVVVDGRPRSASPATVSLEPLASAEAENAPRKAAHSARSRRTVVGPRGYFQFDTLEPGPYTLTASQEGFPPTRRMVKIVSGAEAILREPLTLGAPKDLRVRVIPAVDPRGKPWVIELREIYEPQGVEAAKGSVDHSGAWRIAIGSGRRYGISLLTQEGKEWLYEVHEADAIPEEIVFEVTSFHVRGRILLGKAPLVAEIYFGGDMGARSAPVLSNEDGEFETFLPRLGAWKVTVRAASPELKRRASVDVEARSDGPARAEIQLGGSAISGEIMDADGAPVKGAVVDAVRKDDGESRFVILPGASFRMEACDAGRYDVRAWTDDLESPTVAVDVTEDSDPAPLRLVLHQRAELRGQVVTSWGAPVGGAIIQQLPQGAPAYPPRETADADGFFSVHLPAGTKRFAAAILARGYAMRVLTLTLPEQPETVPVVVTPDAGKLIVRIHRDASDKRFPLLVRDGIFFPPHLGAILGLVEQRAAGGVAELSVSGMEPGTFSLCMSSFAGLSSLSSTSGCTSGVLASGGELVLEAK